MKITRMYSAIISAACLLMSACGGGGSGGGGASTIQTPPPPPSATVTGVAAKGLLLNAIVNFYSVTNGVAGTTTLATVRTNATTGAFSSPVTSAGPVVVTLTVDSTSQMLDEITGVAIPAPLGLVLHTVFDSLTNLQPISVTPLTEMAYDIAKAASGGLTTTNIDAANNAVGEVFLSGASVLYTPPIDLKNYSTATVAEQEQAKLLAALSVAAYAGTATDATGKACTGTYAANIVCMIGGLGDLLTLSSSGAPTLGTAAAYIEAAYTSITSGAVTLEGGMLPSALGLNVATAAETAFDTAIGKLTPFPGYSAGATPLANTKAFFADVRTNIVDQSTSQTFGYAPTLTALQTDIQDNVRPVGANTVVMLSAAYTAAQLITAGNLGSGTTTTPYTGAGSPLGIAIEPSGSLLVSYSNNLIAQVTTAGVYSLYAGIPSAVGSSNGPLLQATFDVPDDVALDGSGDVYVADTANNVIRKITAGVVSTFAGSGAAGSTDATGMAASFNGPTGITVDGNGNVYVTDSNNGTIRKITPAGVVSTLAGQAGVLGASNGTGTAASFTYPFDIAADSHGNLCVADIGNNTIRFITPAGVVSTLAGTAFVTGSSNGTGPAASFNEPAGVAVDTAGNCYVADFGNDTIRKVTPVGVVTTLAGQVGVTGSADGTGAAATFNGPGGLKVDSSGNIYLGDTGNRSIRKITSAGVTTTVLKSAAVYKRFSSYAVCGWDPVDLGTAANVAVCRYGSLKDQMLLTVTQTGTGSYSLETQALGVSQQPSSGNPSAMNPVYFNSYQWLTPVPTIPALDAAFTLTESAGEPSSAGFSGPFYVNASGGQVQGSVSLAESSNWNAATGSGTLSVSGTLSKGSGGVVLQNATIGSDSVLVLENTTRTGSEPILGAGVPPLGVSGVLDISAFTTDAFSYALKFSLGAAVADKSGALELPSTITLAGSIDQVASGGATTPLFSGSIGLSFQGVPAFDATQPISATNFLTAQVQIAGTLALSGGRVLTVDATANASQTVPTPKQPDSLAVTYSYSTPTGTAELNVTGQYDATDGYTGTLTNNSGIVATVAKPISGKVSGTVTASGVKTATIVGAQINYSDGTVESLF